MLKRNQAHPNQLFFSTNPGDAIDKPKTTQKDSTFCFGAFK